MRIVLVTGSRTLNDTDLVCDDLDAQARLAGGLDKIIVRHGCCPDGADNIADYWCASRGAQCDPMPAEWHRPCQSTCFHKPRFKNGQRYCPVAGHLRNQAMVDKTAEERDAGDEVVCLAYPRGEARGTNDCIRRAKKASIPVIIG